MYVSITGFRAHSVWHMPRFWWHAVAAMQQVKAAPGLIKADARSMAGVQHTRSAWTDRAAMLAFMASGSHRQAMRVFPAIGAGYAFGFEAEQMPDWATVRALWLEEGERRASEAARRQVASGLRSGPDTDGGWRQSPSSPHPTA